MTLIYKTKGEALEYAYLGLNHYAGCSHGCAYCYMRRMDERFGNIDFDRPRPKREPTELIRQLEREAEKLAGTNRRVQLCFSTDPYQPLDAELKLTRAVIRVLIELHIPFQSLTKGGFLARRDFDLYGADDLFGVTMTAISMELFSKIHKRADEPKIQICSLRVAKSYGIKTWVSLEPVIWPSESLQIIEQTYEFVDLYKIGRLNPPDSGDNINWPKFAADAVGLCEKLGVKYYLKNNLTRLLPAGSYHNTDWRKIETTDILGIKNNKIPCRQPAAAESRDEQNKPFPYA